MIKKRQKSSWIRPSNNRRSSRGKLTPAISASAPLAAVLLENMESRRRKSPNRKKLSIWKKGCVPKNRGQSWAKSSPAPSSSGWNSWSRTSRRRLHLLSHTAISRRILVDFSFRRDRSPNPLAFRPICSPARIRVWKNKILSWRISGSRLLVILRKDNSTKVLNISCRRTQYWRGAATTTTCRSLLILKQITALAAHPMPVLDLSIRNSSCR